MNNSTEVQTSMQNSAISIPALSRMIKLPQNQPRKSIDLTCFKNREIKSRMMGNQNNTINMNTINYDVSEQME